MDDALQTLRREFPDATFLALGQTALWDEPTKAAVRLRLDKSWPEARMLVGAHDTDYFAKLPGHPAAAQNAFVLVSHDDATTRGLWSAAGEMSELFGSEDVPTRAQLQKEGGVSIHHALAFSDDPAALLSRLTRAWGWSGIIHGGWKKEVSGEIRLKEILPTLKEQVAGALTRSLTRLDDARRRHGEALRESLLQRISEFAAQNPEATLPQLYRSLLPYLYEALLGAPPANLETTQTTELLRLTPESASLPRFAYVGLFLDPATRQLACDAYDFALGDADAYTLEKFGEGAVPFDLIIAGRGRGTLHLLERGIRIDTPRPIELPGPVTTIEELARRVAPLGPVTLVGKAVAMLPMLAAEFVFVFHEGASGYSHRTRALLEQMRRSGLEVPRLRPILRVGYDTWSALSAVPDASEATIALPEFLVQALGRERIAFDDFAACWPRAIRWEKERLRELKDIRSPRALLAHLARTSGDAWREKATAHADASDALVGRYDEIRAIKNEELAAKSLWRALKAEADALQRAKGDDFRARGGVLDAPAQAERARRFDEPLAALQKEIAAAEARWRELRAGRKAREHGPERTRARQAVRRLEADAERERAWQAKNALQTVYGLPHTASRPSAWWFPLLDPSGSWLREVARTARLSLEPLC